MNELLKTLRKTLRFAHRHIRLIGCIILFIFCPVMLGSSSISELSIYEASSLKQEDIILELCDSVNEYIASKRSNISATLLVTECIDRDIDITFVLAQGWYESGLGTRGASRKTNSVWGVGAWDNTHTTYHTSYKTQDSSMLAYLDLLERRYISNGKTTSDLLKNYVDVNGRRYASNPNYELNLRSIHKDINRRTNIKTLQDEYRHLEHVKRMHSKNQ